MAARFLALVMTLGAFGLTEASAQTAITAPPQAPAAQAAVVATDYQVGPQDVLKITVFGEDKLSGTVRVDSDGTIPIQYLGRVKAEDLTVMQIAEVIRKGLADGYVRNPQVSVEVEQYHSKNVYVLGEVKAAGKYPVSGNATLVDALTQAGSMTPQAGHWVLIFHAKPGGTTGPATSDSATADLRINMRDIESGKAQNILIQDNDTISVPRAEVVYVNGNVRTPGAFPFDDNMTVFQAIGLAGGVSEKGSSTRLSVKRMINGKLKDIDVKQTDFLKPGDQLFIKARRL
jgi:polysaccharide export outer membrane protein